ncbi:MAG: hypothetical protein HZA20_11680 [Nitrospirae bacterium]|nr:hypothetical protein [Nitrospirota bacterium]
MVIVKHRTQISLDDWQYQMLLDASRTTRKSISAIIRELVSEKYAGQSACGSSSSALDIVGIGAGDGCAVAEEHDEYLYGDRR